MKECSIAWIKGGDYAEVSAYSNSKLKGQIERLAKSCPDDVKIIAENDDGSIFAHVPIKWVNVRRPRQMSEEQKEAAAERLRKAKES